jgi:sec-independent protein translocase protein TatA
MIGMSEMVVVGGVLVLVFGASQIPKVARSVGEGLKELKRSVREANEYETESSRHEPKNGDD